jgi:hypothetical protein
VYESDSDEVEEDEQPYSPFEYSAVTCASRQHYHHRRSLIVGDKCPQSCRRDLSCELDNAFMPDVLRIGRFVLVRSSLTQAFHYTCTTS